MLCHRRQGYTYILHSANSDSAAPTHCIVFGTADFFRGYEMYGLFVIMRYIRFSMGDSSESLCVRQLRIRFYVGDSLESDSVWETAQNPILCGRQFRI